MIFCVVLLAKNKYSELLGRPAVLTPAALGSDSFSADGLLSYSELLGRPTVLTPATVGSDCFSAKSDDGLLSIHMVIVPFLMYNASNEAILEREKEYKFMLQRNLAHPWVQCIHLLTTNYRETFQRFKNIENSNKMLISEVKSVKKARDPWDYISDRLLNKDVMFATADIYLGRGFEKVDSIAMEKKKIMYSISRHVAPEHRTSCGKTSKNSDMCSHYMGSHDGFLLHLNEPLPEQFLLQLDFDLARSGMECRVNWLFVKVMNYCVLNPCTILKLFHYHCSDLRANMKDPISHTHRYHLIHPSKNLNCH